MPAQIDGRVVIGVEDLTLGWCSVDLRGAFLICGPPGSGRTSALSTVALAGLRAGRFDRAYYFGPGTSPVRQLMGWTGSASDPDGIDMLARSLVTSLDARVMIVLESAADYVNTTPDAALQALVKAAQSCGAAFVVESETSGMTNGYAGSLAGALKAGRTGLLLKPDAADGESLFKTRVPKLSRLDPPGGRGYLIAAGQAICMQTAAPE